MIRISSFFFLFFLISIISKGQGGLPDSIRFSGVVMDAETLEPLEGASCRYEGKGKSTDVAGQFQLIVARGDTVVFTYIGYKPYSIVISDTLKETDYIAGIFLSIDTVELSQVIILQRYGMNKRNSYIYARNNMTGVMREAYAPIKSMDAEMNQRMGIEQFAHTMEMKGLVDVKAGVGTQSYQALKKLRLQKKWSDKKTWLNYEEVDLLKKLYYLEKRKNIDK